MWLARCSGNGYRHTTFRIHDHLYKCSLWGIKCQYLFRQFPSNIAAEFQNHYGPHPRNWEILALRVAPSWLGDPCTVGCTPCSASFTLVSAKAMHSTLYPRKWEIPELPVVPSWQRDSCTAGCTLVTERFLHCGLYPREWEIPELSVVPSW